MESIISTFHIDWKIIIAQAFNFGVVFVVLYIYALKPLSKLMKERSDKISKGLEDAKNNATLLQQTQVEYNKILDSAKREVDKIFQEGKKESEIKKAKMLDEAKIEVSSMIESGKKALDIEKKKMVEDAKKEITNVVLSVTEKLMGSKMDNSFTEKAIKELENL